MTICCAGGSERCVDCRAFVEDKRAKASTTLEKPGICTDPMGPDGLIEGNNTPKQNNSGMIAAASIETCFKPKT